MKSVRKYIAADGTEFDSREACKAYETGGEFASVIDNYLDTLDFSELTARGTKVQRSLQARAIAGFLHWSKSQKPAADAA